MALIISLRQVVELAGCASSGPAELPVSQGLRLILVLPIESSVLKSFSVARPHRISPRAHKMSRKLISTRTHECPSSNTVHAQEDSDIWRIRNDALHLRTVSFRLIPTSSKRKRKENLDSLTTTRSLDNLAIVNMVSNQGSNDPNLPNVLPRHEKSIEDDMLWASSTVPERYRGTVGDKDDMKALGKIQVLRRNFKFPTMLAFASTVLVAWEILPVISVYALENGGTPIIFWGIVVGIIGMTFVYASLAEMASMFPTAGGQYRKLSTR
jgi:hypothetical protein